MNKMKRISLISILKENKEGVIVVVIVSPMAYSLASLFAGYWYWWGAVMSSMLGFIIYFVLKVIGKMQTERLKIFFVLKLKEIWRFILVSIILVLAGISVILITAYLVVPIIGWITSFTVTAYIFLIFAVIIVSGYLYSIIRDWIKLNWRKAGAIARENIKNSRRER